MATITICPYCGGSGEELFGCPCLHCMGLGFHWELDDDDYETDPYEYVDEDYWLGEE